MRIPLMAYLLGLAACAAAEGDAANRFTIDTTASGIEQVTSSAPNGWRNPAKAWRLEPADTFAGPEGSPGALVDPRSLAVDAGGRVYVADEKPTVIKVFAPTGELLRTIGRDGEGPGEFRVAFLAAWKDRLVVHDPRTSRTSVFDTSGTFLKSWHSACCYWTQITVDRAGRIYVPAPAFDAKVRERGDPWVRYTMDGQVVDTLWVPRNRDEAKTWTITAGGAKNRMMMRMGVPFTPELRQSFSPSGGFVYGWSGGYRLALSPHGQDTTRLFGRDWTPDPIPEERRLAEVERQVKNVGDQIDQAELRSIMKVGDIPTTAPAFMTLDVDLDGNVWARQLMSSDSTRTTWDVFDARGVWLGPVTVDAAIPEYGAAYFGKGELYASVEDELGRPVVVRFRVAHPQ